MLGFVVGSSRQAVLDFLAFAPAYTDLAEKLAEKLADAVTMHATPVGYGTVARTERTRSTSGPRPP